MSKNKKNPKILILLISIIISFVFIICGSFIKEISSLGYIGEILLIISIVLFVVLLIRAGKRQQKLDKSQSSSQKSAFRENPTNNLSKNEQQKLKNNNKLIWKFDAFVRDYYKNLPLDKLIITDNEYASIRKGLTKKELNANDLRPIVNKMIKHLGQVYNYASIEINKVEIGSTNTAGYVNDFNHNIVVNYHEAMNELNIVAILAHEISHCYQFYEFSKYPGDKNETELFTDFLTVYLGFGDLVLFGKKYEKIIDNHIYRGEIGYLSEIDLKFAKSTANARREMKNLQIDEKKKLYIVKNKASQALQVFPQYKESIELTIQNLTHYLSISKEDLNLIQQQIAKYNFLNENNINLINIEIVKSNDLKKVEILLEDLYKELKKWFYIYIELSKILEKYKQTALTIIHQN